MVSRRWHCVHCGQTFVGTDIDACTLCRQSGGLVDPDDPAALRDLVRRKQQDQVNPNALGESINKGLTAALLSWRIMRLGLGGVFSILLAGFLLFNPDLRSNPRGVSFSDILVAIGPLLVGVFLLFAAWANLLESRSRAVADKDERT